MKTDSKNQGIVYVLTDQAIAILDLFDNKQEITEEVNREIDDDLTGEDKASRENLKWQKRPNLNFIEMGIPVGSVIVFGREPDAVAPTPYWYFNGKSLADIYEQTYPFADD